MHAFGRTVLLAATLMSSPGMTDDIRVLGVGAVQNAARALAGEFTK
jgi:hypothetical protein